MASNIARDHWNNGGYILIALVSGVLFGVSPVMLKFASADFFLSAYTIGGGLLGLIGFFLMQKAMYLGKISTVVSLITAVSIVATLILSIIFLSEQISYVKWFGAIAIILGSVELVRKSD